MPGTCCSDPVEVLSELRGLRDSVVKSRDERLSRWAPVLRDGAFLPSARNLAAYLALRSADIRELQLRLADLGLSSLGRSQAHVLPTLDAVIGLLAGGSAVEPVGGVAASAEAALASMEHLSTTLFGGPSPHRSTRIMVTLPAESADEPGLVRSLVAAGMDCARINCGHGDPEAWARMAAHVRTAAALEGRRCSVLTDLSGPRLRTGPVELAPPVVHLNPGRDARGLVIAPARVVLDASGAMGGPARRRDDGVHLPARLAVPRAWLNRLEPGGTIELVDAPGRHRVLRVVEHRSAVEVEAEAWDGCYLEPGSELRYVVPGGGHEVSAVGPMADRPVLIRVQRGDLLELCRADRPGHPAGVASDGAVVPAGIPTMVDEVLADLRPDERVLIDDGAVEARVRSVDDEGALLEVVVAGRKGTKLRSEKGLNFPDSDLHLPSLTDEDLEALDAVVGFADVVGYSFVRSATDMDRLAAELARRDGSGLGILAKIETSEAVARLPEIIVHGAARHPFGVMIARGDLAIEVGFERLAEMQEEILWLCEAAHVPVVWATQVLDKLVATGVPTRSEITDAAMADRADCVMLNKGPFQVVGVNTLHDVLTRTAPRHLGHTELLPPLPWGTDA